MGSIKGLAWCDYDDDGDLDLAVMNTQGQNVLLRNETNNADFIKVRFRGRGRRGYSNSTGVGVRVTVYAGSQGLIASREISGGTGDYTSMDAPEAHFGAPAGDTFNVIVTWPASGIVDTIPNVVPPARLRVTENRRPGLFSLSSPPKGAEVSRKPTLVWHRSTDPDGDTVTYDLWYGQDPTFKTHIEVKGLTDTTWAPSALLDSATYYWKVLAIDRTHRVISYRNRYTDTTAVDSVGADAWCNEKGWYFNAAVTGITEKMADGRWRMAASSLTVVQNPVRGDVVVRYTLPVGEAGILSVYDATGRVVRSVNLQPGTCNLQLPALPPGVYFVRLVYDTQTVTTKLIRIE